MDDLTPEALRQLLAEIVSGEKPPTRLIGYARVSTEDQNLDLQIDALKRAGVAADDVYVEKISGAAKRRPALQRALKALRSGDALVVWKLDRLARGLRDLINHMEDLHGRGVGFRSISESVDWTSAYGRLAMMVLGAVGEFERQLTIERTRAGIRAKRERGGTVGAPRKVDEGLAEKRFREGWTFQQVADEQGVVPNAIRRYVSVTKQRALAAAGPLKPRKPKRRRKST